MTLHDMTLHYMTWHCITLHYIHNVYTLLSPMLFDCAKWIVQIFTLQIFFPIQPNFVIGMPQDLGAYTSAKDVVARPVTTYQAWRPRGTCFCFIIFLIQTTSLFPKHLFFPTQIIIMDFDHFEHLLEHAGNGSSGTTDLREFWWQRAKMFGCDQMGSFLVGSWIPPLRYRVWRRHRRHVPLHGLQVGHPDGEWMDGFSDLSFRCFNDF